MKKKTLNLEINGLANMKILIDMATPKELDLELYNKLNEQILLLERYMLAVKDAVENDVEVPNWHDVKAKPLNFPTLREKMSK